MGTRCDFYVGREADLSKAEWIGSYPWDGYPDGIDAPVLRAQSEPDFREAVTAFLAEEAKTATLPARGWPWPWKDSNTTDYAYLFDLDKKCVRASCFGGPFFDPNAPEPDEESEPKGLPWPDMTDRKRVRMDGGSGLIVLGFPAAPAKG